MSSKQPLYTEVDLQAAIEDYQNGFYKSQRAAAASRGIPESTFRMRVNGKRQNRQKAHIHQQLLDEAQEEVLIEFIIRMSEWGLSPRRTLVMEMAYRIADRDTLEAIGLTNSIGDKWYDRFVKRHSTRLESSISVSLEKIRHTSCSREAFIAFFALVKDVFAKYGIQLSNVWNMDEKPFVIGKGGRYLICHKKGLKRATTYEDGNCESCTVLEAGNAEGRFLPPLILITGAKATIGRFRHLVDDVDCLPGARVSITPNGYIDRNNFAYYIEHHFHPLTKPANPNEHCLLFLDGHDSHLTYRTLQFCYQHNIHVVCYPGHSTHLLQPLDVGVFSPLANAYKQESLEWSRTSFGAKMRICDFFPLLHRARIRACTSTNMKAGFRSCGLSPWDPERVLQKLSNSNSDLHPPLNPAICDSDSGNEVENVGLYSLEHDILSALPEVAISKSNVSLLSNETTLTLDHTQTTSRSTSTRFALSSTPSRTREPNRQAELPFKTPKTVAEIREIRRAIESDNVPSSPTTLLGLVEKMSRVALDSKARSVLDKRAVEEIGAKLKESQKKTADRREIPMGFQATTEEIREKIRIREEEDAVKKAKQAFNARKRQEKTLRAQLLSLDLSSEDPVCFGTPGTGRNEVASRFRETPCASGQEVVGESHKEDKHGEGREATKAGEQSSLVELSRQSQNIDIRHSNDTGQLQTTSKISTRYNKQSGSHRNASLPPHIQSSSPKTTSRSSLIVVLPVRFDCNAPKRRVRREKTRAVMEGRVTRSSGRLKR